METTTMGRVTCEALVENIRDEWLAEDGLHTAPPPRKLTIKALVDTGATLISLPTRMIRELGLRSVIEKRVITSAGVKNAILYEAVRLTIQGRSCTIDVMEVPDEVPPLIGYIALEQLDFVVDPKAQKLIGNPEHGGEHMYDLL